MGAKDIKDGAKIHFPKFLNRLHIPITKPMYFTQFFTRSTEPNPNAEDFTAIPNAITAIPTEISIQ